MIIVNDLTKVYNLYSSPQDRLKEALHPLKKEYHKKFYALKGIYTHIKRGEIVGVIGNNGSGKSTFLKLITSVLSPSFGEIITNGKITALLELGSGFNPELTGLENLYLNAKIGGFSDEIIDKKIKEIIGFADIGEFIYQPLKTYSSGMKARLAFSFSIHIDPEILIIDEILSVGDASFQRKCFAKLEEFKKHGVTILFVSHSIAQIIELCDKAIWLNKGEKVLEGNTKEIAALYQKYGMKKVIEKEKVKEEYKNLLCTDKKSKIIFKNSSAFKASLKVKPVEYDVDGARIYNVMIVDENHSKVNLLEKGQIYFYSYKIKFYEDFKEVNLAIALKTKTGMLLGGKGERAILHNVKAGDRYDIKWKFTVILNHGIYLFNCGVNAFIDGKKRVLHRIIDAYIFEVQKQKDDYANNYVDFGFDICVRKSEK